jgi:hypothetical protein
MDAVKRAIYRVRRKHLQPAKMEDPIIRLLAKMKAEVYKREFWERDKRIVRTENFRKARLALAAMREEREQEKERQVIIADERLKNLKKARRRLAKLRSTE